jgi:hypothetical protein
LNMASWMDDSRYSGPIITHRWYDHEILPHTDPNIADVGLPDYIPVLFDLMCVKLADGGVVVDDNWVCELFNYYNIFGQHLKNWEICALLFLFIFVL